VTLATHRPVGVKNPALVAAKERALLDIVTDRPGLRAFEIAPLALEPAAATMSRLNRLGDRGLIERMSDHRWYLSGAAPDANVPEEIAERARPPFDPSRWVQHVDFYLVLNPLPFACRRYG
jgi:hypothetical protein